MATPLAAHFEHALRIAVDAHAGQLDDEKRPYILHVLQVVAGVRPDLEAMTVAALHDVVEDSPITLSHLRDQGFPESVLEAVDAISRRDGETYEDYIERVVRAPLAIRVKLADLEHNMDVRRLSHVTPSDAARLERYRAAWVRLSRTKSGS